MLQHTTRDFHRIINHKNGGNSGFASAHHMRLASQGVGGSGHARLLCLSTPHAACIQIQHGPLLVLHALPQHTTCGLHRARADTLITSYLLCLSTPHAACIPKSLQGCGHPGPLPQHTTCGLHPPTLYPSISTFVFASAHHMRLASYREGARVLSPVLCLSTPHAACIGNAVQILCRIFMEYAVSW